MFASLSVPTLFTAWASGTATGLGLFAVVGAQSAFILRQGILRAHVLSVIFICALIDAVAIFASVTGLQALMRKLPWLTSAVLWLGVAFLSWYAFQSARRALRAQGGLSAATQVVPSRRAAVLGAVGFTLLNPHFWLDIVVVGSLANGFADARMAFAAGAVTASLLWLTALGVGARMFTPFFSSVRAWRVLDGVIAFVMASLALGLTLRGI